MQKLPRGELPPGHEGGGRAPLPRGPTVALLHLSLHPSSSSASHKHEKSTQARVPAPVAVIFDLLAQSTSRKTAWGDCSLVCDSSIGSIRFCSSALFIANLCCIGDHVLELACQIYMVPSSSNALYRLQALMGVVAINFIEVGSLLFEVTKNFRLFQKIMKRLLRGSSSQSSKEN